MNFLTKIIFILAFSLFVSKINAAEQMDVLNANKNLVKNALNTEWDINAKNANAKQDLMQYLAKDYTENFDGKTYNLDQLIQYLAFRKKIMTSSFLTFDSILAEGDHVAVNYVLHVTSVKGKSESARIIGVFKIKNNKILALNSLSRLMSV